MKRVLILLFCLSSIITVNAQHGDEIPYIYYYSHVLNGIVIERADGTDSRIIGQGLVEESNEYLVFVEGAGWSPTGGWFAWRVLSGGYLNEAQGYVVNVDGETHFELMADLGCVTQMWWHPTDDILLILHGSSSKTCNHSPYPSTFSLFDVDEQALLATLSIEYRFGQIPIFWGEDYLQFQQTVFTDSRQDFLITMSFDGDVSMEEISEEQATNHPIVSNSFFDEPQNGLVHYHLLEPAEYAPDPPLNSSAMGLDVSVSPFSIENWYLVGYEFCAAGCAGVTERANVYNSVTGQRREISSCGAHFACVGWLPDRVNVNELPVGLDYSVLPVPDIMDFEANEYDFGFAIFSFLVTHEIVCETYADPPQVQLIETGEVLFTLPNRQHCAEPENGITLPVPVMFALSPDENYYAITDDSEFTALYHADSGEQIARFNFYGIRLRFSEDSSQLITSGRFAEATWDVQRLIEQYGVSY